ncbi:MAG TPA: tRNA (adenosine(37)-N6)-dimethylallyltransferase MiaA [Bacteroidia bacterium]|nr:tRNA (adenosine(37)-N6)-dimethylallyltransferase MiaA [Bacteroidia bacterium]
MFKTLVVIAGPTAVGKTALSIEIANCFNTEIISADSRQFYKEISIGTAKPTKKELGQCKHHFIGNISLKEQYSAAQFEHDSLSLCSSLFELHDLIILTGGSGLYIDALCHGFDETPSSSPAVRKALDVLFKEKGIEALQQRLSTIDPEYAAKVDINNPQRLMRALEINEVSGQNMSFFQKGQAKHRPFNILKICLTMNRAMLYERINKRVDKMIKEGLEDEALAWYHLKNLNALQTVGYKEFFDYFEGKMSYVDTVEKIKQNSRNYAKRQLTWFKRDKLYHWFDVDLDKKNIIPFIQERLRTY